jgi:hypothetical protein
VAEINGLLNRRTSLKMYRGFESLPHRTEEPQLLLWLFVYTKEIYYSRELRIFHYDSGGAVIFFRDSISNRQIKNKKNIWPLCTIIATSVKQNKQKQ